MLKSRLITYILSFILVFAGYTTLNWLLQVNLKMNINVLNICILIAACCIAMYFLLRPIFASLKENENGLIIVPIFLIGFSLFFPAYFSQPYFSDWGYQIISINTPVELNDFPKERFFKIKSFVILPANHITYEERSTIDKHGTTQISKYYITPVYNDSTKNSIEKPVNIGYGEKFITSMLYKKNESGTEQELKALKEFDKKSTEDFEKIHFNESYFFERIENTDDAENFRQASKFSSSFEKTKDCLIIVKREGTLEDLLVKEKNRFLNSTIICLSGGVFLTLLLFYFSNKED